MKQDRYDEKRVHSERRREIRKEKSREAARCRRGKEGEVFADLTNCLPMPDLVKSTLDKTTIVRLTINYMRTRDLLQSMLNSTGESYLFTKELLSAMHGFVLVLSVTGEVMYVTTNVREALGLSQVDMIGNKLSDFIHPCDLKDFISNLKLKTNRLSFLLRVKSTLLPKGRVVNLKSATYKVVRFDGRVVRSTVDVKSKKSGNTQECILLTGLPLASLVEADDPDSMSFTSNHNLDMMFTRCDSNVSDLLGYSEDLLLGASFYELVHPADIDNIDDSFKALFSKGQTITDPYRFMAHGGGFARVVTEATVVYNSKTTKPQNVVCVHKVISKREDIGSLIAAVQMLECKPTAACQAECTDVFADTESLFAAEDLQMSAAQYRVQTADPFDSPSILCSDVDGDANILEATASLFDADYGSTDDVENEERCDDLVNRELEMLVEKLDNDVLDVNSGLMVDMQDLCDEGFDLFMRAPYISMTTQENLDLMNDLFNSSSTDSSGSASSGACDFPDSVGYRLPEALIDDLARHPCYASSASSPTSVSSNEDYLSLFDDIQYSMSPINSICNKRSASDKRVSEENVLVRQMRKEPDKCAVSREQMAHQSGMELSPDCGGYWKPSITTVCAYNRTVSGKQHPCDKQEGEEHSHRSCGRLSHRAAGGKLSYVKGSGHPNLSAKGSSLRSNVNHSAGSVQNHTLNQACTLVGLKREDRRGYPPHKYITYDVRGDPPFSQPKQEDEEPIECSHMLKRIKLSCDRNAHADLQLQHKSTPGGNPDANINSIINCHTQVPPVVNRPKASGLKILRQMLVQDLRGENSCSQ